tara:strand:- start:637 stop:1776 length:1140 start_codon:yes stop_codon:yes gene_type:complete
MNKSLKPAHIIKKNQIFNADYVFIDGVSRCGKAGIAPIVSSFERVEHFKNRNIYDRFLLLYESGDLSKQGFKYLFESELINDVWSSMMGRDVNTNLHDQSSIMNSPKRKEYIARTNRKDTPNIFDEITNEINKKNLIFPYISDDFMTLGNLLSEINEKFKYIIVMRNPIDLVFTNFRSGRPSRLGTDPRYNKPAFKITGFENLPCSMLNMPEKYNQANPLEKCFMIIEKQLTAYLNTDILHSKNSCLVPFENYYVETEKYIKLFENFLGTPRTKSTNEEMIKANVPRKTDIDTFSKKANIIFDNMSDEYVQRLKNLCERYETEISDIYKLNSITKYSKGKFKGLSIDAFSQISEGTRYHKGKRSNNRKSTTPFSWRKFF